MRDPYYERTTMQLKPRKVIKVVVRLFVGAAVGTTVKHLMDQNTEPEEDARFDPVLLSTGSAVLGWMAQDYAGRYTDEFIDDVFETTDEIREAWKHRDE
jgi:hypothetical protein